MEREVGVGERSSDLEGTERGWTGPSQTHPLLFSRLSVGFHVMKGGGTSQLLAMILLTALPLPATVALVTVL